ncbi:MAG TPA: GDP-mannose 4,6-dehydratase [bacterium]|mgnify:CR=1 FL=1|nr:GDP-mannose 4,6-dehydratase [bacterium]
MKKIFITGITGFVGLHLTEYLISQNCRVFGLFYPAGNEILITNKFPNVKLYYCNLLNLDSLKLILSEVEPDIIFHLAGISSVKYSFQNVGQTIDVNTRGFCNLIECSKILTSKPKIIFISTADVYANKDTETISESTPVNPISPYSISKYSSELYFRYYIKTNQARGVIVRPFNHIGSYQREEFALPSFAKQIAMIEKYNLNNKTIYTGNLSPERDFSDVRDIVRGYYLLACAENIDQDDNIFNIASGKAYSIKFLLEKLISLSKVKDLKIELDPKLDRPVDIKKSVGDYSKLNKYTGWQPQYDIEDTLKNILDYWRFII